SGVVRERRVEQAERVRKVDLLRHLEPVAQAETDRGRRPFSDDVHGEDGGSFERRREEGARGVALVVLGEEEPFGVEPALAKARKLMLKEILLEQFLPQPEGDRHRERAEAPRRKGQVRLQQAIELDEWLVIERDVVHLVERDASVLEAVGRRVAREASVVL